MAWEPATVAQSLNTLQRFSRTPSSPCSSIVKPHSSVASLGVTIEVEVGTIDNNRRMEQPQQRRPSLNAARGSLGVRQGRIRRAYPGDFKRRICRMRDANANCSLERFSEIVKAETGWTMAVSTIARIIKERDVWFSA